MDRETLNEYLITYEYQTNRIEAFDKRIEELASGTEYVEKVKKLSCFLGVKTHTALSCLVETGITRGSQKGISMPHIWDWRRERIQAAVMSTGFPSQKPGTAI